MSSIFKEWDIPLTTKGYKARNKIILDFKCNTFEEEPDFWHDCIENTYSEKIDPNGATNKIITQENSSIITAYFLDIELKDHDTKHMNSLQNYDNFIKGKKDKKERYSIIYETNEKKTTKNNHKEESTSSIVSTRIINSSLADMNVKDKEETQKKTKTRSAVAIERSKDLYLKAIQKIEIRKNLLKEKIENEKFRELEKCTFKPKINNYYKSHRDKNQDGSLKYKENKKNKNTINGDSQCTFTPKIITPNNLKNLFKEKTIYDRSCEKYIQRVNKARIIESEKQQKLNPDYNTIYDKLYKKKTHYICNTVTLTNETDEYCTFNPNPTITNYTTAKKTLHEHLHSIDLELDTINKD